MENDISKLDLEEYSDESINFMFDQANKLIVENVAAFREMTTKSYLVITLFLGLIGYAVKDLTFCPLMNLPYYVLILGLAIGVFFIYKNLFPKDQHKPGTLPVHLIKFVENHKIEKPDQLRAQKITVLKGMNEGVLKNREISKGRNRNYRLAIKTGLITIGLYALIMILFSYF